MSYHDALRIIADDTEVFTSGNAEYERGQLELVADLFARPGVERGVRVEEVRQDVCELARLHGPDAVPA